MSILPKIGLMVALRKESVDRNLVSCINRAVNIIVALRKESVDRNLYYGDDLTFADGVALRKESVDRNCPGTNTILSITGRSPQGERG